MSTYFVVEGMVVKEGNDPSVAGTTHYFCVCVK